MSNCEVMDSFKKKETRRIMKNVFIISFAFMLHMTAYNGAGNLQSSINTESGLGTMSLAAVNIGLVFSSIFLPVVVIKWLGTKWASCFSIISDMPYFAAQLFPSFYVMIPTALVFGLGFGILNCAVTTHLFLISEAHSKMSKIPTEVLFIRFMGISFMILNINQVFGNLISFVVLSTGANATTVSSLNDTMIPILCGRNFLTSSYAKEALILPSPEKIQTVLGIYLTLLAAAALIMAIGVDSTKRYDSSRQGSASGMSGKALFFVALKLITEPAQLLLIFISIFIGMQMAFFVAEFTAAFVSCTMGTSSVGFVIMLFGISDAIGCVVTGYISKLTGRQSLISFAFIVHAVLFSIVLTWHPQAGDGYILCIIAVLWGLCDSMWILQINVCYGIHFPGREQASFAINQLWMAAGFIIMYVISPYTRVYYKVYLLLAVMVVGMLGYVVMERQQYRIKKTMGTDKGFNDVKDCEEIISLTNPPSTK